MGRQEVEGVRRSGRVSGVLQALFVAERLGGSFGFHIMCSDVVQNPLWGFYAPLKGLS